MRHTIAAIIIVVMVAMGFAATAFEPSNSTNLEDLAVDLQVNCDGLYSLIGDARLQYDQGSLVSVRLMEPMLVGYRVSSDNQGTMVLPHASAQQLIRALTLAERSLQSGDVQSDDLQTTLAHIDAALDILGDV